jgi:Zn finger protein HypA/HybF involved in hydrogenase expression
MKCIFCKHIVKLTDEGYYCPHCKTYIPRKIVINCLAYEIANEMNIELFEEES